MKKWRKPGTILLFLALSFILVLSPASQSMAEIPVYIVLDFDDPAAGQFRTLLEQKIVALGGITLVNKDHLSIEDCAILSVVGFRYKGPSGEDLGFPFSYAIGYSEPGDSYLYYEYHNVLVGYANAEGLSWAAGEIADELDVELALWW
ncbi:MAG: hypothetical protein Q7I97_10015 [Thermovirgaceae bacterium]|nr:hypothetical protein [Thermovirgaceae bacterium]